MSTDSGSQIPSGTAAAPAFALPQLLKLQIRRIPFAAPKLVHFESALAGDQEVIEFLVETAGAVPARGFGPALFVGNVEINQSEWMGANTWRLLAFEPENLEPGAPIDWGWMRDPVESRQKTDFSYWLESQSAE